MSTMTREGFLSVTTAATWANIDDLVAMLDAADFWDEAFLAEAAEHVKKSYIRGNIKRIKDDAGWPLFASVVTTNPMTGQEERRYKQEAIFDRDDYAQVVRYHLRRAEHHQQTAMGYARNAHARYGLQLSLDFTPTASRHD